MMASSSQIIQNTRIVPGTEQLIVPRRLLIVEDHENTATVMQRLLQRHGHKVWTALRYHEALDIVNTYKIEVLICDLDLPDGDGCDLLRELKLTNIVEGIVVSGHGEAADMARSSEAGFAAHLVKPFDITQIEVAMTKIFKPKR